MCQRPDLLLRDLFILSDSVRTSQLSVLSYRMPFLSESVFLCFLLFSLGTVVFSVLIYHRYEPHLYQEFSLMVGLVLKEHVKTLCKSNPVPGSSREPFTYFWHSKFWFYPSFALFSTPWNIFDYTRLLIDMGLVWPQNLPPAPTHMG